MQWHNREKQLKFYNENNITKERATKKKEHDELCYKIGDKNILVHRLQSTQAWLHFHMNSQMAFKNWGY